MKEIHWIMIHYTDTVNILNRNSGWRSLLHFLEMSWPLQGNPVLPLKCKNKLLFIATKNCKFIRTLVIFAVQRKREEEYYSQRARGSDIQEKFRKNTALCWCMYIVNCTYFVPFNFLCWVKRLWLGEICTLYTHS